jgi:hypothetical protein
VTLFGRKLEPGNGIGTIGAGRVESSRPAGIDFPSVDELRARHRARAALNDPLHRCTLGTIEVRRYDGQRAAEELAYVRLQQTEALQRAMRDSRPVPHHHWRTRLPEDTKNPELEARLQRLGVRTEPDPLQRLGSAVG